jgi:nicotinamidase-related amidase
MHDPFYDLFPRPVAPPWEAGKVALMTIDMQYLDAHPDGWMGRIAKSVGREDLLAERFEGINAALPNIRRLQDAFRAAGQEVMHVRIAYKTADARETPKAFMPASDAQPHEKLPLDNEFLADVAPVGDEIVFDKTSSSVFSTTDVERILWNLGIRYLVFTGLVTDGCVELSARDAADRGWAVTLVEDACCSSTRSAHVDAIERMTDGGFIDCVSTDQAVKMAAALTAAVPA